MHQSVNLPAFEQRVRERAYALWEREGRPFGRDAEHWRVSEEATLADLRAAAPAKKAAKPKFAAPRNKSSGPRGVRVADANVAAM